MRKEQQIFEELGGLCVSPGYSHVLANFCFRDNFIRYGKEMKADDAAHMHSRNRLIRTEISTLIGLMLREPLDFSLPKPDVIQRYMDQTEELLEELHHAMSAVWFVGFNPDKGDREFDPFSTAEGLREPIFYGSESAYGFQYRDFTLQKYAADAGWIKTNKGFSIQNVPAFSKAIANIQNQKLKDVLRSLRGLPPDQWTLLPGFTFTAAEVCETSKLPLDKVDKILRSFSFPKEDRNSTFTALNEFNAANASPLIQRSDESYILFQQYSLFEAGYESPFYWISSDRSYVSNAMINRGRFTEQFSKERLELVFGAPSVHSNVTIQKTKSHRIGEVDVMVIFGNRAIILQAKSKRLTAEARKGNDNQLKGDFKKAIQDSYDQALVCARALISESELLSADGHEIKLPYKIKEVYPLCIVADHYPALNFQSRQFLRVETDAVIKDPLVADIFALDAMAEMLNSPLDFLHYLQLRAKFGDKLLFSHELTGLSFHLKYNLWFGKKYDMMVLEDDFAADLDIAMLARREGIPGKGTPDGILTRRKSTTLGRIVSEIEADPDPAKMDLGLSLLTLGEDTIINASRAIDRIAKASEKDGTNHDVTFGFDSPDAGLTVHCNSNPIDIAGPMLERHCIIRKYSTKAENWFGLCIRPGDGSVRFGLEIEHPWQPNEKLDALVRNMPPPQKFNKDFKMQSNRKIGRNDPCPCGSGIKYKKCCLKTSN